MNKNTFINSPKPLIYLFILFTTLSCGQQHKKAQNNNEIDILIQTANQYFDSCEYKMANIFLDSTSHLIDFQIAAVDDSTIYKESILKILLLKGQLNRVLGDYSESWYNFQQTLRIANNENQYYPYIYKAYCGLGILFFYYQDCSNISLDFFHSAMPYSTNKIDSAFIYYALAESYIVNAKIKQKDPKLQLDSAEKYLSRFIKEINYDVKGSTFLNTNIVNKTKRMEPWIWESKAKLLDMKMRLDSTIIYNDTIKEYYNKSLSLNNNPQIKSFYQICTGLYEKGKYLQEFLIYRNEAKKTLFNSYQIAKSINNINLMMSTTKLLSKSYKYLGNIDSAYYYLNYSDSLGSYINDNKLYILNTNLITKQDRKKEIIIKNAKWFNNLLTFAIILLIIIVILLIILYRLTTKSRSKTALYAREIERANNNLEEANKVLDEVNQDLESHQKIQDLLLTHSRDGIFMVQENVFVFINQSFCNLTQYSKDDLLYTPFIDIVDSEYKYLVSENIKEEHEGYAAPPFTFTIISKTGKAKTVTCFSGHSEIKNKLCVYGYLRDITDEVTLKNNLELKIAARTKELKQALDDQRNLLLLAIHELDGPTNAIRGKAQVLKNSIDDSQITSDKRKLKLNDIIDFCDFLFMLSRNVTLSQNEITLSDSEIKKWSLGPDLLNIAIYVLRVPILNKSFSYNPDTIIQLNIERIFLLVNKNHFQQVFFNILNNAVKFAHDDPNTFKVAIKGETTARGIKLFFNDWGIGIPKGEENLIFDKKERGSNASNKPGMGLGLWVVRKILQSYDAEIRISNNDNPTTFEIFIPNRIIRKE